MRRPRGPAVRAGALPFARAGAQALVPFLVLLLVPPAAAQQPAPVPPLPGRDRPAAPAPQPAPGGPRLALPPPEAGTPLPPIDPRPLFTLTAVRFTGNTALTTAELEAVAAPFLGRPAGSETLEALRQAVTRAYLARGYVNSGAVLPDQEVAGGVVALHVVEGRLDEIAVTGTRRLPQDYVRDRVARAAGTPFDVNALQSGFQLLLQDPLVARLDGRLSPGPEPGTARLDLHVEEKGPVGIVAGIENSRSPATGALLLSGGVTARNLLGLAELLTVSAGRTEGGPDYGASASLPLSPAGTRLTLSAERSSSAIVETALEELDVRSTFRQASIGVRHPLLRSADRELGVGLSLSRRRNETFIFRDRPFSFAPGAVDGRSDVTVLRLAQDYVDRGQVRSLAARATVSVGLDALGATVGGGGPDGRFTSLLLQGEYARSLGGEVTLVARADAQYAFDRLLTLEQFGIGGIDSVRGYRQNRFVRDNGLLASAELRVPLSVLGLDEEQGALRRLVLIPFADYGRSWNRGSGDGTGVLASVGLGAVWAVAEMLEVQAFYGRALRRADRPGDSLQDRGIHFRVRLTAF